MNEKGGKKGAEGHAALKPLEIAEFLRTHPDFLAEHPEILARLIAPAATNAALAHEGDNIRDFQQFMVRRLQDALQQGGERERTLLHASRTHAQAQSRVHDAVLALMDAPDLDTLIQIATNDLAIRLGCDVAILAFENREEFIRRLPEGSLRLLPPGFVQGLFAARDVVCATDDLPNPSLFGQMASLVRSSALLRLEVTALSPPGLLALGSRDAARFPSGLASESLLFLARVLGRQLRAQLGLTHA